MSDKNAYWDRHLGEILNEFISIPEEEYRKSRTVFNGVFNQMKAVMRDQCPYFKKYCTQVLYAGSVYDGIKICKLDEYDMDVVIRLPIDYNEISIENDDPAYVKLKIGKAFDRLPKQKNWENYHKVTYEWRDSENYFLQSEFRSWIHSIMHRALNKLKNQILVDKIVYEVKFKQSGPAYTLNIRNAANQYELDVDVVPVIRFQHPRWPKGYRKVPETTLVTDWLAVPKPRKVDDEVLKSRCWRLSFQDFERDIFKGCNQLKPAIRLMKKLRDNLEMKHIASYYIKTLFLWKIAETKEKSYWRKGLVVIFRIMVEEFHNAVKNKIIRYYWQEHHNLIGQLLLSDLDEYAEKLHNVLDGIDNNDVDRVRSYLLNKDELKLYNLKVKNIFYENQVPSTSNAPIVYQQPSIAISSKSSNKSKTNKEKTALKKSKKSPLSKVQNKLPKVQYSKGLKGSPADFLASLKKLIIKKRNTINYNNKFCTQERYNGKTSIASYKHPEAEKILEKLHFLNLNVDKFIGELVTEDCKDSEVKILINKIYNVVEKIDDRSMPLPAALSKVVMKVDEHGVLRQQEVQERETNYQVEYERNYLTLTDTIKELENEMIGLYIL